MDSFSDENLIPPELEEEVDACCDQAEAAWTAGEKPSLEQLLGEASQAARPYLLRELAALERHYRRDEHGRPAGLEDLAKLYPKLADELAAVFDALDRTRGPSFVGAGPATAPFPAASPSPSDIQLAQIQQSAGLHVRCPHCSNAMEILADTPFEDVTCRSCGSTFNLVDRDGPTDSAATLKQLGRFELISRLGMGAFGTVWKARDSELDRLVAVKIPRKGQLSSTEVEQFFREARAAAQLRHPNIVAVYEVGRADETVFIVSDLVRGVPLADLLTGDPLSFPESAELCEQIARALHHAHQQGVIHRDLKPSNIMIDENRTPLIMDFGLAKRDLGEITMTVDGQILGTPSYMSPEQARGQSHWTDRRSDIYSLGVVLFKMLTSELPFRGNARMQLHNRLTNDAPDPCRLNHAVPRDLATICLKCLERDPNHRYSTAQETADELRRYLNREPIKARPISRASRAWRWARRKPALASALSLTGMLAIAGPVLAWQQYKLAVNEQQIKKTIETRLEEREGLITQQREDLNLQSERIENLNREVLELRGGVPGVVAAMPNWRIGLITNLLDAREAAMLQTASDQQADHAEAIRAAMGLGILWEQLGQHQRALDILKSAQLRFAALAGSGSSDPSLIDARADCLLRISRLQRLHGDEAAALATVDRAIALRRQLVNSDESSAAMRVRLLESTVQKTTASQSTSDPILEGLKETAMIRIGENWPTSTAEFYALACQLTMSDVLLNEE